MHTSCCNFKNSVLIWCCLETPEKFVGILRYWYTVFIINFNIQIYFENKILGQKVLGNIFFTWRNNNTSRSMNQSRMKKGLKQSKKTTGTALLNQASYYHQRQSFFYFCLYHPKALSK